MLRCGVCYKWGVATLRHPYAFVSGPGVRAGVKQREKDPESSRKHINVDGKIISRTAAPHFSVFTGGWWRGGQLSIHEMPGPYHLQWFPAFAARRRKNDTVPAGARHTTKI